jgi:hypothetical protein
MAVLELPEEVLCREANPRALLDAPLVRALRAELPTPRLLDPVPWLPLPAKARKALLWLP